MNPVAKYFLARLGLFAAIAAPLSFVMNVLLALAIGLLGSLVLSTFLIKGMRGEMIDHIDARVKERREEKQRLRAELKGEEPKSEEPQGEEPTVEELKSEEPKSEEVKGEA
ncbi:DUF4229 domain-containing protein [Glycomyces tenuis]|uniref:DUF4229 domain-containing protein n=1 Tax=Glycomyces tenuis TaxID=58116 RepID=UPI000408919E|nr:DUF4229 domain-containing protein [Glycomyces tenuis]